MLKRWRTTVLSFIGTCRKRTAVRPSDNAIAVVLKQYQVKTFWQNKIGEVLSAYVLSSGRAPGNIMAEAYYEQGDAAIIWVIERWSNEAFYKMNSKSAAAKMVNGLAELGLAELVEIVFLEDLEGISREAPRDDDQPLTIMLLADLKAGTEDRFRSINQEMISAFRKESGLLVFTLSRMVHHKTRFVIYKKFRNLNAFQHHLKDPAVQPVLEFLQTAVKEPPFEKGYHHLIQLAPL
ncbi:quinol monooxygenase YgiN [Chitinophaga ginsengisoli]|uniref:Quinol monooxygenase YgiN n=2 Tax=Chitinophaga ginsengisoli TaxID=363837 RepID=A0A2P8FNP4_9BACT|nr:quinol monooxygenase YgiN [Chitinophaga ginsengisoli]